MLRTKKMMMRGRVSTLLLQGLFQVISCQRFTGELDDEALFLVQPNTDRKATLASSRSTINVFVAAHFNATFHPTPAWVIQKLREAFPYDTAPQYLIFDRDAIFSRAVVEFITAMGTKPFRISFRSPWQSGAAEHWIGTCRRDLLGHVVVFGERHLVRLVRTYISYYHEDRCHLGLGKDTPDERPITPRSSSTAKVVALQRVGGLHHRVRMARSCVVQLRFAVKSPGRSGPGPRSSDLSARC